MADRDAWPKRIKGIFAVLDDDDDDDDDDDFVPSNSLVSII